MYHEPVVLIIDCTLCVCVCVCVYVCVYVCVPLVIYVSLRNHVSNVLVATVNITRLLFTLSIHFILYISNLEDIQK